MTAPDGEYKPKNTESRLEPEKELSGDASNEASDSDNPSPVPVPVKRHHNSVRSGPDSNSQMTHKRKHPDHPASSWRKETDPSANTSTNSTTENTGYNVAETETDPASVDPPAKNLPPEISADSTTTADPEVAEKRFFCRICNQGFSRKHNMVSHELIHLSNRPHVCPVCDATFRRIHDLRRHEKLHLGEKPFHCPYCHRGFARTDALTRHSNSANGCSSRPTEESKLASLEQDANPQLTLLQSKPGLFHSLVNLHQTKQELDSLVAKPSLQTKLSQEKICLASPSKGDLANSGTSGQSSGPTPNMEVVPGLSASNPVSTISSDEMRNNLVEHRKTYDVNRWCATQQDNRYVGSNDLPPRPRKGSMPLFTVPRVSLPPTVAALQAPPLHISREYHHHIYHHHDRVLPQNGPGELLKEMFRDYQRDDSPGMYNSYNGSPFMALSRYGSFPPMDGRSGQYLNVSEGQYWGQQNSTSPNPQSGLSGPLNLGIRDPKRSNTNYGTVGDSGNPQLYHAGNFGRPFDSGRENSSMAANVINSGNAGGFGNLPYTGNKAVPGNPGNIANLANYANIGFSASNTPRPDINNGKNIVRLDNSNSGNSGPVNSPNVANTDNSGDSDWRKNSGVNSRGFVSMRRYNELVNYTNSLQSSLSTMENRISALENENEQRDVHESEKHAQNKPPN